MLANRIQDKRSTRSEISAVATVAARLVRGCHVVNVDKADMPAAQ